MDKRTKASKESLKRKDVKDIEHGYKVDASKIQSMDDVRALLAWSWSEILIPEDMDISPISHLVRKV